MRVSLTPKLERFVKAEVKAGSYTSASEVVREALRLMQAHKQIRRQKLRRLREELQKGEASLATGDFVSLRNDEELAAFFARL